MHEELVEDPVLRQRYRFSRDADLLRVELWAEPGSRVPEHFHPALEERWEVLDGEVTFSVDGRSRRAGPGERLTAPAGVRHAFENTGGGVAHMIAEVDPALEMQEVLELGAALNRTGGFTRRGIPKNPRAALQGAEFLERYRDSVVFTSFPPPIVQRLLLYPLARLERRRRGRAERRGDQALGR
jgi:mannose-6-phosphate isomerase-like protein (cupin superfamily)